MLVVSAKPKLAVARRSASGHAAIFDGLAVARSQPRSALRATALAPGAAVKLAASSKGGEMGGK